MNVLPAVELLSLMLLEVVIAEQRFGAGKGEEKLDFALNQVKPWFDKPRSPALSELGDVEAILKAVTAVINAIVKLFNLLGFFRSSSSSSREKSE